MMPASDTATSTSLQSFPSGKSFSSVEPQEKAAWGTRQKERRLAAAEMASASNSLNKLAAMPANWDGYGGLAIHPDTIMNAKQTIANLWRHLPAADITPNPNGTLSFEWESERGIAYLELGRTKFSFYIKPNNGLLATLEGEVSKLPELAILIGATLYPSQALSSDSSTYGVKFANELWY